MLLKVKMKLSDQTISILKNYSTINESLLFTEGNRLRTIAKNKSLLASAKIEEPIPVKFAIYNLNQFLSAMTMFGQADLDFTEKSVKMTFSDGRSINYTCADESLVITPPDKEIADFTGDVSFVLTNESLDSIKKASATLGLPEVVFVGKPGTNFVARLIDLGNPSSSSMEIELPEVSQVTCEVVYKVEVLKLMSNSYQVDISKQGIGRFTTGDQAVTYHITSEKQHTKFE